MNIQCLNRDNSKSISTHILIIGVFILYETCTSLYFGAQGGFWDYALFYILNICFFYLNAFLILRYALNRERVILRTLLIIIIEFTLYILLFLLLASILKYFRSRVYFNSKQLEFQFVRSIFRGGMILMYSMVYCFARHIISQIKIANRLKLEKAEADKKRVEIENKMLLAENALLESQIKTHLLFNTLSYVYDKTMDLPGGPGEAVMVLTDVMRYSLKKVPEDGKVPLPEEIDHIKNIIRLGELRHDGGLFIEFETGNIHTGEFRVIASMLSTFIENMFKYGDLKDVVTPAKIMARVEKETLFFRASNKKAVESGQVSHKIGLENVRKRLEYSYGNNFELIITDNPKEFIVDLKVPV